MKILIKRFPILVFMASVIFYSCTEEKYDKKLEFYMEGTQANPESGFAPQGLICTGPGNECRTTSSFASEETRNSEYVIFKQYYDNNDLIAYFSNDQKYQQLFPQFTTYMSDIRANLINGTYKVKLDSSTRVVAIYIDNLSSLSNVVCAFQL